MKPELKTIMFTVLIIVLVAVVVFSHGNNAMPPNTNKGPTGAVVADANSGNNSKNPPAEIPANPQQGKTS